MDVNFDGIKKIAKNVVKHAAKHLTIPIIGICIVFILVNACFYYITIDDASYDEGDNANTPYAVSQYSGNVLISSDGNIEKSSTAQELWDKMLEDGSRVDEYLSGPEELQKLINAQMVTDYIDTRENPDEEIDWEAINKDVNSKTVQGVIKLKRAKNDGTISNLKYTDPETFQMYIDNYNASGSEEDKEIALSYFTLEKGYVASTSNVGIIYGTGDFTKYTDLTDAQLQGIANLCKQEQGSLKGAAAEASLMANLFELGNKASTYGAGGTGLYNYIKNGGWFSNAEYYMNNGSADQSYVDVVKAVLVGGKRTIPGYIDEHDCFSDIISATNNGTSITVGDRSQYVPHITKMANRYTSNYTFYCFPEENSDPFGYTSEANRMSIGDCYYDFETGEKVNGQSSTTTSNNSGNNNNQDVLCWPTIETETTVSSYFGPRTAPTAGASTNHKGIDISIATGTEIYAMEDGTVTTSTYSDSAGYYIVIDHGNGYISKYMHNSKLEVSAGQQVQKGQPIAKSGNTGISTGPHLHFQIEFNENPVDPLSFKYNNGMGNGVGGTGSNTNSVSTTSVFYAKVATWNEMTDIIDSNDPAVENKNETTYNMTTTSINYQQMVSGYKMPFDYLWAWLVMSQDKDFIFELTDLVYGSEIDITVHDNLTINTNVSTDVYKRKTKVITDDITVKATYQQPSTVPGSAAVGQSAPTNHSITRIGGPFNDEKIDSYTTTHTIITKTNTLNICITKANVWLLNYTQEFIQEALEPIVSTPSSYDHGKETYPETYDRFDNVDTFGLAEKYRQRVIQDIQNYENAININATVESLISYYYTTVYGTVTINNKVENTKYIEQTPIIEEKVDKTSSEPNFVNILLKYGKVRNNINSASRWLFDILEKGPNTNDMVDLTKFLLYKTTELKIYWFEGIEDFSVYDYTKFKTVTTGTLYGGTVEEKVWWALIDEGYSEYAAAGAMGNIFEESAFKTNNVQNTCEARVGSDDVYTEKINNGTYSEEDFATDSAGYGLCQWTSSGRKRKLHQYAMSKGTTIDNADMQINYFLGELTGRGDAASFASRISRGCIFDENVIATHDDWQNATSVDDATLQFMRFFESPGSKSSLSDRQQKAQEYYDMFHGKARPTQTGDWSSSGVSCPRYYQSNQPWSGNPYNYKRGGTISSGGCGACALAMAVSGLTGQQVTPDIIVSYLNSIGTDTVNDGATSARAVAQKYGLTYERIDRTNKSSIDSALDSGKCLIFSIKANGIYTGGGHFIMCHGRSGNSYFVLESGSYYQSNTGYAFNQVFSAGNQGVFVLGK